MADGDAKYGAAHSMLQMACVLKEVYEIDITVLLPKKVKKTNLEVSLRKNGIDVCDIAYTPFYQNCPVEKWKQPVKYILRGTGYIYTRFFSIFILQRKINIKDFDIVHSNSSREDVGAMVARKFGLPLVWHIREFGDRDYKCYSYRKNYIDYMNSTSAVLVAVSDTVKKHWVDKGIKEEKIVRVYNGVKPNGNFHERSMRGNDIRLVIAGGVSETKGQKYAIEIVKRMREKGKHIFLDIIGDGNKNYVSKLHELIERESIGEYVNFLGYREDVEDLLLQYDIGLVCSKDEAFGRVTVEYMMAGLPVLASNTGANAELIREEKDGLLYSYGNMRDMEEKLTNIIINIDKMGGRVTREYAIREFADRVNAENIYNIYKSIGK